MRFWILAMVLIAGCEHDDSCEADAMLLPDSQGPVSCGSTDEQCCADTTVNDATVDGFCNGENHCVDGVCEAFQPCSTETPWNCPDAQVD